MKKLLFTLIVGLLAGANLAAQDYMEVTPRPACQVIEYDTYVDFVFTSEEYVDELNVYVYMNNQYVGNVGGLYPWSEGMDGPTCIYTVERTQETQEIMLQAQSWTYGKERSEYLEITYTIAPQQASGQTAPPVIGERYEPDPVWNMPENLMYYDSFSITFANGNDEVATVYYRYHYTNEWDGTVIESDWKSTVSPYLPSPGVVVDPDLVLHESAHGWVEAYAVAENKEPSNTVRHEFYFNCYPSAHYQRYYDFIVDGVYYTILDESTVAVSRHTVDQTLDFDAFSGSLVSSDPDWYQSDGMQISGFDFSYYDAVVVPETVQYKGNTYTVTAIKDYAFMSSDLPSLQLPSTLTSIGKCAFYMANIPNLTIPESLTSIGDGAFAFCDMLTEVTIPASCDSIGDAAFARCDNLASVALSEGLEWIGVGAFGDCMNLTEIEIPASVTWIGGVAFRGCVNLAKITCRGTVPPETDGAFINHEEGMSMYIYENATLFVPNEALQAYHDHPEWSWFYKIVPYLGAEPGDINGDGSLNVGDVTGIINLLINAVDDVPAYCDVNGDGAVNINDVTMLINMLMNAASK
ncbi:MAG: leucine-rich repeat protein [Muribaculaceae bacterium]|nr:leucine-rich repeat protein [Muribaculaceae bacterium]